MSRLPRLYRVVLLLAWLAPALAPAAGFVLDEHFRKMQPDAAEVLLDPQQRDYSQLRAATALPWHPANGAVHAGFTRDTLWLRFTLRRGENGPASVQLEIGNPLLDELDVYLVENDMTARVFLLGDTRPAGTRPFSWRNIVVPVDLPANRDVTVYLRARTIGSLAVPLTIWEPQALVAHQQREQLVLAFLYGAILGALVVFFFVATSTGKRGIHWSLLFIAATALFQAHVDGLAGQYLPVPGRWWNEYNAALLILLMLVLAVRFSTSMLPLDTQLPLARRALRALLVLFGIVLPLATVIGGAALYPLLARLGVVVAVAAVPFGLYCMYRRLPRAPLYTLLMTLFAIGISATCAGRMGTLPAALDGLHLMLACVFLQVGVLGYTLARRVRSDMQQREQARQGILATHKRALASEWHLTYELEREVERQTGALSQTMQELRAANRRFAEMSRHDALTGLHNRRYFDERYPELLALAARQQSPLGVLMVDIDHFKEFNDVHGHMAGDECLRQVGAALRRVVVRSTDLVARYGGEEFVVLLPDTEPEEVLAIAKRMRVAVEALQIGGDDNPLRVTISVGVAARAPATGESLLAEADAALYRAKQRGRNCVVR